VCAQNGCVLDKEEGAGQRGGIGGDAAPVVEVPGLACRQGPAPVDGWAAATAAAMVAVKMVEMEVQMLVEMCRQVWVVW